MQRFLVTITFQMSSPPTQPTPFDAQTEEEPTTSFSTIQ
jgi:hypothetical protein